MDYLLKGFAVFSFSSREGSLRSSGIRFAHEPNAFRHSLSARMTLGHHSAHGHSAVGSPVEQRPTSHFPECLWIDRKTTGTFYAKDAKC